MNNDLIARVEVASEIARAAGVRILEIASTGDLGSRAKTNRLDLVTRADEEAEMLIHRELQRRFPGEPFIGEEHGVSYAHEGGSCWVVDPLDGTANFVRGIPHWCISIGCLRGDRSVAGVIYDPVRNDLFAATSGSGVLRSQVVDTPTPA